jgi:transposase
VQNSDIRVLTKTFANSPPCACRGSSGRKSQYGLMMLEYQRFTAVLLLIHGSLFLSEIYYCLRVFWCAVARRLELELEHWTNAKFLVKLGKSGSEIWEMLVEVYGDHAMKKTAVYKWVTRFYKWRESVTAEERSGRPALSRNEENIAVCQILQENHRLTVRSLAEKAKIDRETVRKILNEDLDMREVCAKMVPKEHCLRGSF